MLQGQIAINSMLRDCEAVFMPYMLTDDGRPQSVLLAFKHRGQSIHLVKGQITAIECGLLSFDRLSSLQLLAKPEAA